jgi:hypothetical protein
LNYIIDMSLDLIHINHRDKYHNSCFDNNII